MTLRGVIIIDILAILFIGVVLLLLRGGRLYASYGALWIGSTLGLMLLVSVPSLLAIVTTTVGAVFPVSALTLLAFVLIVLVLVLFSVKLTELHERQTTLIQALALQALDNRERQAGDEGPGSPTRIARS
jgi:hypothetical protein